MPLFIATAGSLPEPGAQVQLVLYAIIADDINAAAIQVSEKIGNPTSTVLLAPYESVQAIEVAKEFSFTTTVIDLPDIEGTP